MTLSSNSASSQATWYLVNEANDEQDTCHATTTANTSNFDSTKFFVTTITTLPQRPKNYLLVKYSLLGIIFVDLIQTIIFIPLLGDLLQEMSTSSPYFAGAPQRTIISLGIASVLISLIILTTGLIGTLLENFYLLVIFATLLIISVLTCSLPHIKHKTILLSAINDTIIAILAIIFARMVRLTNNYGDGEVISRQITDA